MIEQLAHDALGCAGGAEREFEFRYALRAEITFDLAQNYRARCA